MRRGDVGNGVYLTALRIAEARSVLSQEKPPVSAIMVRIPGASDSLGIGLNQYEAIIAINPKDDAKEVAYDIRIDQPDAQK